MFNGFVFACLVEIEADNLTLFVEFKQHLIHSTVSDSSADIAVRRRYFAVTVIEALREMFSSADVENLLIKNPEINVLSVNMKTTECTAAELVKFATYFSLLRVELQSLAMFVSLRNERLNE